MTNKFEPRFTRTVLALSIAAIGGAVTPLAWSQEDDEVARLIRSDSEIEVGVGYVSKDSYKFGDYKGLQRDGAHVIGDVSVVRRDRDTAKYVEIKGTNLGLESRNIGVRTGQQGNYGVRVEYDEIQKLWSDSYQTPYLGAGTTDLSLPAGWVTTCAVGTAPATIRPCTTTNASASTGLMTQLNANMRSFNVDTKRKSLGVGVTKELPRGWDVDVSVKSEKKEGTRLIGGVFGTSGGNPRAAILPEPVDYVTDQIEALARYADKKLQLQFGYHGSFFRNENSALRWQNAYANGGDVTQSSPAWGTALAGIAGYPNGFGQIGLPPDNEFHQISASAGYSFTKATRISGSLSFGRMTQDDTFLPYTVNPGLSVTTPLPRNSLDGKVDTTHADLKLTSTLMPKLYFTGVYRYDERDNKTPQATYNYIGGDSANQVSSSAASDRIRTNLPGSSRKQQIDAEVDYHYTANTKLKFGYGYEWAKKTFEAITDEKEHTVKAEVHQHFNDMVSGGLGYAFSDRDTEWNGQSYNASAPFIASFSTAYLSSPTVTTGGVWDNVPTQYKYFMAPRKRDKIRAFADVSPSERVDLHFGVDYKDDDYHKSVHGLQRAKGWAANFDMNVIATDALTAHFFTSLDRYSSAQTSVMLGSSKANATNPLNNWGADIADRTLTVGIGARYKPLRKYEVGGDVTHASSKGKVSPWTTPGAGFTTTTTGNSARALPDVTTRMQRLDLFGSYQLQKDVTVKLKYIYERYSSTDWGYDQVTANTLANVIGTNQTSPDYNVHFVGVSVAYQF